MVKNLNGIRGILFLLIFLTHFKYIIKASDIGEFLFPFLNNGGFVVTFFFILSGFTIYMGYSDIFKSVTKENYKTFISKRLIKFYPLYILTGLILLLFLNIPQRGIVWVYHFILLYIPMLTPWTKFTSYGGNSVGWFLASIFYSYLAAPFVIMFFNRKVKTFKENVILELILYFIMAGVCLICVLMHVANSPLLYTSPIFRLLQFMMGINLAMMYKLYFAEKFSYSFKNSYVRKSITDILIIIMMIFCMVYFPKNIHAYREICYVPVIIPFILYLCCSSKSILYDFLNSKIVLFLGGISFEGYLIHNVVLELSKPYCQNYIYTWKGILYICLLTFLAILVLSACYKKLQSQVLNKLICKQ